MSTPNDPIVVTPAIDAEETSAVEKQSIVRKGLNKIKTNKKAAIAVAALAGLVVVSAVAGRKTAPDAEIFLLEPADDDNEIAESTDTTVA